MGVNGIRFVQLQNIPQIRHPVGVDETAEKAKGRNTNANAGGGS